MGESGTWAPRQSAVRVSQDEGIETGALLSFINLFLLSGGHLVKGG